MNKDFLINSFKSFLFDMAKSKLSEIKKYRDMYRGEECYFFGNGISLKWFEMHHFSDKVAFGSSVLPFHNSFSELNARFILLTEPFWFYPKFWTENITSSESQPELSRYYRRVVKDNHELKFIFNLSNFPVIRGENIIWLFRDISDNNLPKNFISKRIGAFGGSLRVAITLAIYMGFDHIYLAGCDYTHRPSRNLHWYEKGKGEIQYRQDYEKEFFNIAKEFINITAITIDSEADIIDSVNYKDYTGFSPLYKENNKLLSENYLKLLDTVPKYNIF